MKIRTVFQRTVRIHCNGGGGGTASEVFRPFRSRNEGPTASRIAGDGVGEVPSCRHFAEAHRLDAVRGFIDGGDTRLFQQAPQPSSPVSVTVSQQQAQSPPRSHRWRAATGRPTSCRDPVCESSYCPRSFLTRSSIPQRPNPLARSVSIRFRRRCGNVETIGQAGDSDGHRVRLRATKAVGRCFLDRTAARSGRMTFSFSEQGRRLLRCVPSPREEASDSDPPAESVCLRQGE